MKAKNLTLTAMCAALCCILAPIAIPVGAVPVSLALFAVMLTASLSGSVRGTAAVGLYIALGAVGLPVFAGFTGGFERITSATGGFIIGYLPCALLVGLVCGGDVKLWRYPVGMAAGTLCCYAVGTVWFAVSTCTSLMQSLTVCVLPFVLFDAIKIAAASAICPRLKKAVSRLDAVSAGSRQNR